MPLLPRAYSAPEFERFLEILQRQLKTRLEGRSGLETARCPFGAYLLSERARLIANHGWRRCAPCSHVL